MKAVTIPLLPCADIDEAVSFYEALGFRRTYRQVRPNPYAVVELGESASISSELMASTRRSRMEALSSSSTSRTLSMPTSPQVSRHGLGSSL